MQNKIFILFTFQILVMAFIIHAFPQQRDVQQDEPSLVPQQGSVSVGETSNLVKPKDVNDETDDDNDSEEGSSTSRWYAVAADRITDYTGGIAGIANGLAQGNVKDVLHGSIQFIPPPIRVGVDAILGSIIGSPLKANVTTTVAAAAAEPPSVIVSNVTEVIQNNTANIENITIPSTTPKVVPNINQAASIQKIPVAEEVPVTIRQPPVVVQPVQQVQILPSTENIVVIDSSTISPSPADVDDADADNDESSEEDNVDDEYNNNNNLSRVLKL